MNVYRLSYSILVIIFLFAITNGYSQSPYYSESLIKYDLLTHKTDKPIPFDKSFTLIIEKLSTENIFAVHAYEAEISHGMRVLVYDSYRDCDAPLCKRKKSAIKDIVLSIDPKSKYLQIYFPPLRPNVNFDINIIYNLSYQSSLILESVNSQLAQQIAQLIPDSIIEDTFKVYQKKQIDLIANRTYSDINYDAYKKFYEGSLKPIYADVIADSKYKTSGKLTEIEIQAIDILATQYVVDFKDAIYLFEISKSDLFEEMQSGIQDITEVFTANSIVTMYNGYKRLKNLDSNKQYFESVIKMIDRIISKGHTNITVGVTVVDMNAVRTKVETIRTNLQENYSLLKSKLNSINNIFKNDPRLKEGIYLVGNTLSSDLKSAGGSIFFIDAGLANIVAPSLTNTPVYIPKLYWGINAYFRPIDKNTRRNTFSRKFIPGKNRGCRKNASGIPEYGPDYNIVTKRSIFQHLSLNIGITLGSMIQKDFDNFYNSNSLLLGPAYRFARAFKVSAGVALLKRTSTNPLISDKQVVACGYISLSVDIDFIQGIKDITSIFFK